MTRFRRKVLQRQRQVNDAAYHSLKKRRKAYAEWQANQIKIWNSMNEVALEEEKTLKNSLQSVDNKDQS